MLRRIPNPSALVGMVVILLICITAWSTQGPEVGFPTAFSEFSSFPSMDDSEVVSTQKVIAQAAPRVAIEEASTTLGDIQNATLGVSFIL